MFGVCVCDMGGGIFLCVRLLRPAYMRRLLVFSRYDMLAIGLACVQVRSHRGSQIAVLSGVTCWLRVLCHVSGPTNH